MVLWNRRDRRADSVKDVERRGEKDREISCSDPRNMNWRLNGQLNLEIYNDIQSVWTLTIPALSPLAPSLLAHTLAPLYTNTLFNVHCTAQIQWHPAKRPCAPQAGTKTCDGRKATLPCTLLLWLNMSNEEGENSNETTTKENQLSAVEPQMSKPSWLGRVSKQKRGR